MGRTLMSYSNQTVADSLGNKLKALRKLQYPTDDQRRFAARINVSRATYQKMEKGDLSISLARYLAAAELLGVADGFMHLFSAPQKTPDLIKELDL